MNVGFERINEDRLLWPTPVICIHESGHALVAYCNGDVISGIRAAYVFVDADLTDSSLAAAVGREPNSNVQPHSRVDASLSTTRLLAGEIAARYYHRRRLLFRRGLLDRIHLDSPSASVIHSLSDIDAVISGLSDLQLHDDIGRVLCIAREHARGRWWEWVWRHHSVAGVLVRRHWRAIKELAKIMESALPAEAAPMRPEAFRKGANHAFIPGDQVVALFHRHNVEVLHEAPACTKGRCP